MATALSFEKQRAAVSVDLQPEVDAAVFEGLSHGGAAESKDFPAAEAGIPFEIDLSQQSGVRTIRNQRLLRQPFQGCAVCDGRDLLNLSMDPSAEIPARGPRGCQQRMCVFVDFDVDSQIVAANDASRRMEKVGMTNTISFRVEGTLDREGSRLAF